MAKKKKKTTVEKPKRKRGGQRGPKIILTAEHFEAIGKFASVGCSQEEIADMLGSFGIKASHDTIRRRIAEVPEFKAAYERGLTNRNVKLRSRMFQQAMMMNGPGVHQAQFLAVNWLGMSHKVEHKHAGEIEAHVQLTTARERVAAKLEVISRRLAERRQQRLAGGSNGGRPGRPAEVAQIAFRTGSDGD